MRSRYIKSITNNSSIIVDSVNYGIEDSVISYMIFGNKRDFEGKNKIYYNSKGEPYFKKHNKRHYLKDFMLEEY
jgi:hypothetical protein